MFRCSRTREGVLDGLRFEKPSAPVRVTVLAGDRLVVAVDGPDVDDGNSALAGVTGRRGRLADTNQFTSAATSLGQEYAPVFYLDVQGATDVVTSAFGESSTPSEFEDVGPYLERLSHVIAGVSDEDLIKQRAVVGTTEP